jgi:Tol biopolymer transport system component
MIPLLLALTLAFPVPADQSKSISKVCFTRGEYVFVKDMKTGVEKRLVKGSYPAVSPDGTTLAYSVDSATPSGDMKREIKLMDLASGKVTSVASLEKYLAYGGAWSPDGSKLAFNVLVDKEWEIGVIDVNTLQWQAITKQLSKSLGVYSATWTPDSRTIVCHDLDKIFQVNLNGQVVRTIATSDVVDDISYISSGTTFLLSSDGGYLLFDTETQPGETRIPMLWVYDFQLKKRTRISPARLQASSPQWLGSDDEIVFSGRTGGRATRPGVYRMKRDGTQMGVLVANADQFSVAAAN